DDDEPSAVITLDDDEARQLGAGLRGAHPRPKIVEKPERALGELSSEWGGGHTTTPVTGKPLAEAALRAKTGITIIAILREPEPVSGAQPNDVIKQGDTLVTVGKPGQYAAFHRILEHGHGDD